MIALSANVPTLRVLHVAPSHARRDGGPSEVLRGILPALQELGIHVELLSTTKHLAVGEKAPEGITTHLAISAGPASINYARRFRSLLRGLVPKFDIVHIHSVHTFTTSTAMQVCARTGVPFVLQPHGAWDAYHLNEGRSKKQLYDRLFDARNLRKAAGAIYSSTRESAAGRVFAPDIADNLVPLGVPDNLFSLPRDQADMNSVLFLGRVAKKKRLDLVLAAMATPAGRANGFRLTVAGPLDEDMPEDPRAMARRLNLDHRVNFIGEVDAAERTRQFLMAGVFVLPSDDESFGMSAAEALAAGVPTVTSANVGIAPSAAAAGGLILVEQTAESVATAIVNIVNNRAHGSRVAAAGRGYARDNFTWNAAAKAAVGAYERGIVR